MKTNVRVLAALASCAVMALAAAPALAEEGPYCGEDGCGGPHGPPSLPSLPANVAVNGTYNIQIGQIGNNERREGFIRDGQTTYFGGGPYHDIGGDGSLYVGQANNNVTLTPILSPLGSVEVNAIATMPQSSTFPTIGMQASGDLGLSYAVVLHAIDQNAADVLTARLSNPGAIGKITGDWRLTATGSSWGSVVADAGGGAFYKACSLINYGGSAAGCGAGSYTANMGFTSGLAYAGGSGLDFISVISLSASAHAGPVNLGYYTGTMDAFIDPSIFLASDLDLTRYSLTIGGLDAPLVAGDFTGGAVPEPATWAMMLLGFGGLGALFRRRRALLGLA